MKSGYNSFAVLGFYEVLQVCYFIFSITDRVVVIKQSIMVCQWKNNRKVH